MAWDFSTEPEFEAKLDWMRGFVREEIIPLEGLSLDNEQFQHLIAPLREEVKRQGLWASHLPPALGGGGFGQVKLGLMHEILGESRLAPPVFGNNAPDSGNAELLAYGLEERPDSEWQREAYLQPVLDGTLRSAFSMTEPGAGSDPMLISTRAVRDGDSWVIDGHKWFTTNASVADFLIVMAVTNPDVHPSTGTSMIIVPTDSPGLEIVRDIPTMEHPYESAEPSWGGHAEVIYRSVRVPAENLIGNEGGGYVLAQKRLGPGRIHHCMRWLGQSRRALDMMCERAVSRYTGGSLLAEKQTIQNWVADSVAEMTAARLMTLHAAWQMDRSGAQAARVAIAMTKFFGAQVLYNVIDRAIQVHGSLGFSTDLPLEYMYRRARSARIVDGPDEVHRITVARKTLKQYKPVDVPSEHVPTRRAAAVERFGEALEELELNR